MGAGIAGLAAALTLADGDWGGGDPGGGDPGGGDPGRKGRGPAPDPSRPAGTPRPIVPEVVVLEADDRPGGKIRTDGLTGGPIEVGPDAFLARVPHAVELCRRLGLSEDLVAPARTRAGLWINGRVRPLPAGLVLGVPTRLEPLARSGILSARGLARAAMDLVLPATPAPPAGADRSVGELVRARLGAEAHERLVEPLLGGINAGRTDRLSAALVAPRLDAAARRSRSLLLGLRAEPGASGPTSPVRDAEPGPAPVFLTPRAGLGRMIDVLVGALEGYGDRVTLQTGSPVSSINRDDNKWVLSTPHGSVAADAVVLAVPSFVAGPLLAPHATEAGRLLAAIDYASVSLVTLAYPSSAVPGPLEASGYLVPAGEGRLTTACTWTSSKWPHRARPDQVLLRVSTGRWGDARHATLDDDALVVAVHRELVAAMAIRAPAPEAWLVTRWPRSFPQYEVGHLERVDRVEAALEGVPPVALAGAAYRGIGIPACIAQGQRAARLVLARLSPAARGGQG